MKSFSRRDLLKTGLMAPAVAAAHGMGPLGDAMQAVGEHAAATPERAAEGAPGGPSLLSAGRERLLLDFGWRFHLGNSNDPSRTLGWGVESRATFRRRGISSGRDDGIQRQQLAGGGSAPRLSG